MNPSTMELLVVMYHHVHSPATGFLDGLHGPTAEVFESQLRLLQQRYQVLNYQTFLAALRGETEFPRRCALITFDDGTSDHYATAFPVLRRLGLQGLFFVITKSVEKRVLSAVHARHLIARAIGEVQLRAEFTCRANEQLSETNWLGEIPLEVAKRAYRWDDLETARFKYALNFRFPRRLRDEILKAIFEEHVGGWTEWGDRFYANWEQLREMQSEGMQIGGHSHSHEALAMLSPSDLDEDIRDCRVLLNENLGKDGYPFSYPFGKSEHFSESVINALTRFEFAVAFANLQGINRLPLNRRSNDHFKIVRVDPKDLKCYFEQASENGFDGTSQNLAAKIPGSTSG